MDCHSLPQGIFLTQRSNYIAVDSSVSEPQGQAISKVVSLLFNMLSSFVISFLPKNKCLLISWLQSPSTLILESKKIKSATVPTSPPIYLIGHFYAVKPILLFDATTFQQSKLESSLVLRKEPRSLC